MSETAQIGELLENIYSDEEEFKEMFTSIRASMAKNEALSEKNKKILDAIRAQVEDVQTCHR